MFTRASRRLILVAALVAPLAGCYVIPVDPSTGRPLPLPPQVPGVPGPMVLPVPSASPAAPTQMQARLYPLNEQATQAGLLVAQITDHLGGRGSLTVSYRGQWLQGEATRVDAGYAAFGRVHEQVLGPARREYSGRRGMANVFGGGLSAQCEYVITAPSVGTGACLFSDGAKYQLHFGQ